MKKVILFAKVLSLAVLTLILISCEQAPAQKTTLTTQPEGAKIWKVEPGRLVELGSTPLTPEFVAGSRQVLKIAAPGFREEYVVLEWPKPGAQIELKLRPESGSVLINSIPAGAIVELDGKNCGVTPVILSDLRPGRQEGILRKVGYADYPVSFEVGTRPQQIMARIAQNCGRLKLNGLADCRVWVDDVQSGITPLELDLVEGIHEIRIERDGYAPWLKRVAIKRGETITEDFKVIENPGVLVIESSPAGATVKLDGRDVGVTPAELKGIEPGEYVLTLSKKGFETSEKIINLAPGATLRQEFALNASSGAVSLLIAPAGIKVYIDDNEIGVTEKDQELVAGDLTPGRHVLTLEHRHAKPIRQSMYIEVNKGGITRLPAYELWVADTEIEFSNGTRERGILINNQENGPFIFSPQKGVKLEYPRDTIKGITPLK